MYMYTISEELFNESVNELFFVLHLKIIYATIGRDRFHRDANPLKPDKFVNICYVSYWNSVLYFLNLSSKHFFSTENGNFFENIQIWRSSSFRVVTRSRMPNRRTTPPPPQNQLFVP